MVWQKLKAGNSFLATDSPYAKATEDRTRFVLSVVNLLLSDFFFLACTLNTVIYIAFIFYSIFVPFIMEQDLSE